MANGLLGGVKAAELENDDAPSRSMRPSFSTNFRLAPIADEALRWSFFGIPSVAREGAFFEKFYSWLKSSRAKSRKTDRFVQKRRDFRQKTHGYRAYTLWVASAPPGVNIVRHAATLETPARNYPSKHGLVTKTRLRFRRFT